MPYLSIQAMIEDYKENTNKREVSQAVVDAKKHEKLQKFLSRIQKNKGDSKMIEQQLESGEPTREEMAAYNARMDAGHATFQAFVATLPDWVTRFERMDLFLMTDKERGQWLADNSPYLPNTVEKPAEMLGKIRL